MASSKTIFVTCFHSLISRNLFASGVLEALRGSGARVVIVAPNYRREFLAKAYGRPGVTVEGVEQNRPTRSRRGLFFKRLTQHMIGSETVRIQQAVKYRLERKILYYFGFILPARLIGRSATLVRLVRWLDFRLAPRRFFRDLLDRYRPALIFASDFQNENDVALMQAARGRGIPAVGMVRSWDNLTQFPVRFVPERLIVPNQTVRAEDVRIQGIPAERTVVAGIPHYDRYLRAARPRPEEFFVRHGFNPAKPLVFFAAVGDLYIPGNSVDRVVLELLVWLGLNVYLRFPPNDTVRVLDGVRPPPGVAFDRPGVPFAGHGPQIRDIDPQDDVRLVEAIAASDVVVAGASTILVDGCLLGKPTILLAIDPRPNLPYLESVRRYLDYDHLRHLVRSGAVRITSSAEELAEEIGQALAHPDEDAAARRQFVTEFCGGRLDGTASRRVAEAVLTLAGA